ncbi:MAG: CYTH domain-containing protein, partial [Ruoffia tabacinasalis]
MVSSIERELKTLLSKAEYDKLYTYFNLQNQPKIIQSNYYYDTADEIFKQNNSALRLRVFDNG